MTTAIYEGVKVSPREATLLRKHEQGAWMSQYESALVVSILRAVDKVNRYRAGLPL